MFFEAASQKNSRLGKPDEPFLSEAALGNVQFDLARHGSGEIPEIRET